MFEMVSHNQSNWANYYLFWTKILMSYKPWLHGMFQKEVLHPSYILWLATPLRVSPLCMCHIHHITYKCIYENKHTQSYTQTHAHIHITSVMQPHTPKIWILSRVSKYAQCVCMNLQMDALCVHSIPYSNKHYAWRICVCVCVCVFVRERQSE